MIKYGLVLYSFVSVVMAWSPVDGFRFPSPEMDRLQNDLQIVWFLSDRLPLLDLSLVIPSDYRADSQVKRGTPELFMSLLNQQAQKLNINFSATAEEKRLRFDVHGLSQEAYTLVNVLHQIVLSPDFSDLDVSNQIGREDLVSFHQRHLVPKNAILLIVGRADPTALRPLMRSLFEGWQGETPPQLQRTASKHKLPSSKGHCPLVQIINRPKLKKSQIQLEFKVPTSTGLAASFVTNIILNDTFNQRLKLSDTPSEADLVSVQSYFSLRKDFSNYTLSLSSEHEKASLWVKKILSLLSELRRDTVQPEQVTLAQEITLGRFLLNHSSLLDIAYHWLNGHTLSYPFQLHVEIQKVDQESIQDLLKNYFSLNQCRIKILGNVKKLKSHQFCLEQQ